MQTIDWLIVIAYLAWVIIDGVRRSRSTENAESYFLANRTLPWWAVGLSVMATQMSAITLVGTTGKGYADGMHFVQFYFGLPLAMIILSVTVVPFFHRARVFTAYEFLEQRFDAKTRALTSLLFLVSRGLSCGVIIAAPSVILSIVLGWNQVLTILAIGLPTTLYTMLGGVQAVTWTDVKQMAVIVFGVGAAIFMLISGLPADVDLSSALHAVGATGRLETIDFRFDLSETYTFWSGMIGGLFLMLSYFGCDQSQVQRYLTADSVKAGRRSLMMSAFFKIPLQAGILFVGILVFIFYTFVEPPMLFNSEHEAAIRASARASDYEELEAEFAEAFAARKRAAYAVHQSPGTSGEVTDTELQFKQADLGVTEVRGRAVTLVKEVTGDESYKDVNYVFPTFITEHLPVGLVGLLIAAIFAAAMSSISSELNALTTASVIDFYRRHLRPDADDREIISASRWMTIFWGLFACLVATFAVNLGSLIEVVNRFGSFFYGSILGVFVLAIGVKRATSWGAFIGLFGGMTTVYIVARTTTMSFLWHNVVGVVAVVVVGLIVSEIETMRSAS